MADQRPTWSCGHPVSPDPSADEARLHVGHAVEQSRRAPLSEMYLVGDEDCGVGLRCRTCDEENWQGGQPLAYGFGITTNPYPEAETQTVNDLAELVDFAHQHQATHHA